MWRTSGAGDRYGATAICGETDECASDASDRRIPGAPASPPDERLANCADTCRAKRFGAGSVVPAEGPSNTADDRLTAERSSA